MTNPTTNGAEELARRIEGIVSAHWNATKKAMLLTTLGKAIREGHPDLVDYLRPTLRRFVEESHAANVITHPDLFQTQGAVPLQVDISSDLRSFFDNKRQVSEDTIPVVSFHDEIWDLFKAPFKNTRYVVTSSGKYIGIVDSKDGIPGGHTAMPVDRSDIIDVGIAPIDRKIDATSRSIRAWVDKWGLNLSTFTKHRETGRPHKDQSDLIEDLSKHLSKLDRHDQARIFVPLDLVAKMLAK